MKCTGKEWDHCRVEKMGCTGCYYDNTLEEAKNNLRRLVKLRKNKCGEIKHDTCICGTKDLEIVLNVLEDKCKSMASIIEDEKILKINLDNCYNVIHVISKNTIATIIKNKAHLQSISVNKVSKDLLYLLEKETKTEGLNYADEEEIEYY